MLARDASLLIEKARRRRPRQQTGNTPLNPSLAASGCGHRCLPARAPPSTTPTNYGDTPQLLSGGKVLRMWHRC